MDALETLANPWVSQLSVYEPGRPIEDVAREMGLDPDGIVKLASNENALGPSPKAVRAMKQAAASMHLYPDGGAYHLRQALSARLEVSPDMIVPGNGSNELIELLGHAFLGPETEIVMAECAFVVYRLVASLFNATTVVVPMRELTHDLDAMAAAITPQTRLVFVGNPNNPTGTMVHQAEIDRFMERVPPTAIVCFDEAYIELLAPERRPDTLRYVREGRPVAVLRTFSKTYGLAGLRLGYAVATPACARLLNRVRQPFNVNAMALAAAVAALDDEAYVRKTRRLVASGLDTFEKAFVRMGLPFVPSVANFILVQVGEGRKVFAAMQREGVIVRPMDVYGLPGHVRVTVGTQDENERCVAALGRALEKP
jgi:histidinol-phosphate aminotransferase